MRKALDSDISQFLTLFCLSFVILFFDNIGFLHPARSVVQKISVPVKYSLFSEGQKIRRGIFAVWRFRSLAQENQLLRRELTEALSKLARLSELEEENQILKEQFEISQDRGWQMIPAFVIGKNRFLQIDQGEKKGIKEGMAVVFKDILVGRVSEVTPRVASVRLVTDPDSKVLAQTKTGAHGILTGRYQVGMILDKVLPEAVLGEGDLVLARAQEGIPSGLLLGKIVQVQKGDSELFQTAEVGTVLDFENLKMVFVTFLKE